MIDGELYRRSYGGPYLKCLTSKQGQTILFQMHEGIYGNRSGGRSLGHKVIAQGYFWPKMMTHVGEYARKCQNCQRFVHQNRAPLRDLNYVISAWPFAH